MTAPPFAHPSDNDETLIQQLRNNAAARQALVDAENDRITRQYGERGEK